MRAEDELASIQRFVLGAIPGNLVDKPKFYTQRPASIEPRPYWKIDEVSGPREIMGGFYHDKRVWILNYFAVDRKDALNRGDAWLEKLYNSRKAMLRIPMWLINFPYYPAKLYLKEDTGSTLLAGSYSVQVVAENDLGQVTKPSAVTTIAVPTDNTHAIVVQAPREPKGFPIGYRFHIYLSGSLLTPTAAHRVGSCVYTGSVDPLFTISDDVPNGIGLGNATALMAGLAAQSEVRYRYLQVENDSVDTQMIEDPDKEGLFNFIVRFQTRAVGLREYPHAQPLAELNFSVDPNV